MDFFSLAVCERACENGGLCIAPNVCSCRTGWTGAYCETDINECLRVPAVNSTDDRDEEISLCPENSVCVNKPGWYKCDCDEGFRPAISDNGTGICRGDLVSSFFSLFRLSWK